MKVLIQKETMHSNLQTSSPLLNPCRRQWLAVVVIVVGFVAVTPAHAIPGDMLDQALHQSMNEHSKAQDELAETGTTRIGDKDSTPKAQRDGLRIVVGQGEILPDTNSTLEAQDAAARATLKNSMKKTAVAKFGVAEPKRQNASFTEFQSDDSSLSADQELPDPAP